MLYNMLLMHNDDIVIKVNTDTRLFEVVDSSLLPYPLRGAIRSLTDKTSDMTFLHNYMALQGWLAGRVLSLSRANAKKLYSTLRLEQLSDIVDKAKVAIVCRAVSVLDNYWVKLENDNTTWSQVNIRKMPLNEIVTQIALKGSSLTFTGSLCTPEFTTNGAYAKAWKRYGDKLYLIKRGSVNSHESLVEAKSSSLLDKFNVNHCPYKLEPVCICECMSNDNLSIVSGSDYISYCNRKGITYQSELVKIDADSVYKMWIVDYLIFNSDRHGQNWGLYYSSRDHSLIGCHPLFDHNNAFDEEWLEDRNATYQFNGHSIRDSAHYAMKRVKFHFTEPILCTDFMTDSHYKEFMWRAKDLGIEVYPETYDERVARVFKLYGIPLEKKVLLPSCELDSEALNSAALNLL